MSYSRNHTLLRNARSLRKGMTKEERHLWYDFLRAYPIKVYRQRIIGNYIADFYCHRARLVIELDGAQHYTLEGKNYDELRTEAIGKYGIKVIRFQNSDIDDAFAGVCYMIDKEIKSRLENT